MEPQPIKKITRSRKERVFAGICGGLAMHLGMDPVLVRVLTVALVMLSNGAGVTIYLLGWFIIPLEQEGAPAYIPPVTRDTNNRTLKIVGVFLLVGALLSIFASFLPSVFDLAQARWLGPIILILIGIVFILWQKNTGTAESARPKPESQQAISGDLNMQSNPSSTPQLRRLMRSKVDRKIAGVCGGVGEYFNVDPTIIRLIWLALLLVAGTGLLLYIICWIAMPLDHRSQFAPPPPAYPAPTTAPTPPPPAQSPPDQSTST